MKKTIAKSWRQIDAVLINEMVDARQCGGGSLIRTGRRILQSRRQLVGPSAVALTIAV